jgi:drug/metabolite transporter (DMT)-like permease
LTPLQVAFYAMGPGWISLFAVLAARRRLHLIGNVLPRGWLVLVAMGFFGWAGYRVALNFAFDSLPLPDAIMINYLHPAFVVLFQGVGFSAVLRPLTKWEQETNRAHRPRRIQLLFGFTACLLGVVMIATEGHLSRLGHVRSAWGASSALFAAFAWGVYSNLDRFVPVRRSVGSQAMLPDIYTFLSMTFGLVMLAAVALDMEELRSVSGFSVPLYLGPWGPMHTGAWWLIVVMGVAVYCGSYTLWLYALERGGRLGEAHKLPPLTYLTPVVGVTLGWLVLHEPFGPGFWQGAALIAIGNAINAWPRRII